MLIQIELDEFTRSYVKFIGSLCCLSNFLFWGLFLIVDILGIRWSILLDRLSYFLIIFNLIIFFCFNWLRLRDLLLRNWLLWILMGYHWLFRLGALTLFILIIPSRLIIWTIFSFQCAVFKLFNPHSPVDLDFTIRQDQVEQHEKSFVF